MKRRFPVHGVRMVVLPGALPLLLLLLLVVLLELVVELHLLLLLEHELLLLLLEHHLLVVLVIRVGRLRRHQPAGLRAVASPVGQPPADGPGGAGARVRPLAAVPLPFLLGGRQLARRGRRVGHPRRRRRRPRVAALGAAAQRGRGLGALETPGESDGLRRDAESLGVVLPGGLSGVEAEHRAQDGRAQGPVGLDELRVGGARLAEGDGDADVGDAVRGGGVQPVVLFFHDSAVGLRRSRACQKLFGRHACVGGRGGREP